MHMYIELYKMFKNVENKSIGVQKILYSYTYIVTYIVIQLFTPNKVYPKFATVYPTSPDAFNVRRFIIVWFHVNLQLSTQKSKLQTHECNKFIST